MRVLGLGLTAVPPRRATEQQQRRHLRDSTAATDDRAAAANQSAANRTRPRRTRGRPERPRCSGSARRRCWCCWTCCTSASLPPRHGPAVVSPRWSEASYAYAPAAAIALPVTFKVEDVRPAAGLRRQRDAAGLRRDPTVASHGRPPHHRTFGRSARPAGPREVLESRHIPQSPARDLATFEVASRPKSFSCTVVTLFRDSLMAA